MTDKVAMSANIAAAMRRARNERGIRAQSIADRLGRTNQWVTSVERNERRAIDRRLLLEWLELIEVDPVDLGIEIDPPRFEWKMPRSLEHVQQSDRTQAENFLEWVFRTRDAYR